MRAATRLLVNRTGRCSDDAGRTAMGLILLGFVLGCVTATAVSAWAIGSKKVPFIVVDWWWLANPDRWEWLRQYELAHRESEGEDTLSDDPWTCKHGPIEYHDDGDPYCPDCDQEAAESDPLTLLDEFDRYASVPDSTPYNGSPFQERVRRVLSEAGLFDANDDRSSVRLGAKWHQAESTRRE